MAFFVNRLVKLLHVSAPVLNRKAKNCPWIFEGWKKPIRATYGIETARGWRGWSGCNILELAVVAEYSGRQVGTHLLMLFLHYMFEWREGREWEGDIQKLLFETVIKTTGKVRHWVIVYICYWGHQKLHFKSPFTVHFEPKGFVKSFRSFQKRSLIFPSQTAEMNCFVLVEKSHAGCVHCKTNVTKLPSTSDFAFCINGYRAIINQLRQVLSNLVRI